MSETTIREPMPWEEPTREQCEAASKMNGNRDWCEGYLKNTECHLCDKYAFRKDYGGEY